MKPKVRILFIVISALLFQNSYSQELKCGWYGKKTVEERNKMFPFNKAKKAVLISYLGGTDGLLNHGDTIGFNSVNKIIKTWNILIKEFKTSYKVKEEAILGKEQLNEFSNILVNYTVSDKSKRPMITSEYACYTPRNSVLFLDEKGQVICVFEICFECFKTNIFPHSDINSYSQVEECFSRFEVLKDFFKKNGVKYGVEDM
ncbi:hypothetical protein AMR72_16695 [Flavobacterium psychrophilum]|nr:hypothetical protein AMR72_16695 [Flavobacterium psychrophilum]AOE53995.1 hypothetical protein ALW18_16685 [Flavobacterium psychrophilum]